jgi:glycosyltransferase involved in cell wall biosynthesis
MPLVSVIINVRNGALFLRDAIDSVLAQTFTDWELVIWDDCSTDDSATIAMSYQDERIRYYLSPVDTPLGEARNNAIARARGEWLAFLDQDDIWLSRKLATQLALADPEVAIIYGRTILFDSQHENLRDYDYIHEFGPLPEGNLFSSLIRDACYIAMSSAMLRRSAIIEAGEIPSNVQATPDYYLYLALARIHEARAVQQVVCRYRVHSASMLAVSEHRIRLHEEPLWMIRNWAAYLDPGVVRYRLKTYSTRLALEEMKRMRSFPAGLRRLFRDGSLMWLLSRPFAVGWRTIRRRIRRPYWLATEFASDSD